MYKVFINNKAIIFTKKVEDFNTIRLLKSENLSPSLLLQLIKDESLITTDFSLLIDLNKINFPHREFSFLMKQKIAAGGLVLNENGEVLMIYRNQMWDLPKGHQDGGESIEECAIREVEEETGITNLTAKEKLTTTYHHYILNEKDILKETHWYLMHSNANQNFIPEEKEGIDKVEWVEIKDAKERLESSWISLLDVLIALEEK